jgi:transcriptional regulator with XRE-family HTH domain
MFGHDLIRRARAHGITSTDLANLLGVTIDRIERFTSATDLYDLPVRTIQKLATLLQLPWPRWLRDTTNAELPAARNAPSTNRRDHMQLHAVLALTIGQTVNADDLAEVLGWPLPHVHDTADALGAMLHRRGSALRLSRNSTHVRLSVRPGALDDAAERRLAQLHHIRQLDPMVFHLIYRVLHGDCRRAHDLNEVAPGVLREALEAGILVERRPTQPATERDDDGPERHFPFDLAPDVAYSLGLSEDLYD